MIFANLKNTPDMYNTGTKPKEKDLIPEARIQGRLQEETIKNLKEDIKRLKQSREKDFNYSQRKLSEAEKNLTRPTPKNTDTDLRKNNYFLHSSWLF